LGDVTAAVKAMGKELKKEEFATNGGNFGELKVKGQRCSFVATDRRDD
jgi:hypothetical protein